MLNGRKVTKELLKELKQATEQPSCVCKMTGKKVALPCSAAGCPLFGDCLTQYEKVKRCEKCQTCGTPVTKEYCEDNYPNGCEHWTPKKTPTNEEWLKNLAKSDLASTLHAFHLGYVPWCDHHCENKGDDGCDGCIVKWLEMPATGNGEPSVVPQVVCDKEITTCKHLSQVKRGDKILLNGCHYTALHDAHQDMAHPRKEWHIEVHCEEDNLYECLYENTFLDGVTVIIVEAV